MSIKQICVAIINFLTDDTHNEVIKKGNKYERF